MSGHNKAEFSRQKQFNMPAEFFERNFTFNISWFLLNHLDYSLVLLYTY